MRFIYSNRLDSSVLLESEVTQLYTELSDYLNAPSIVPADEVKFQAIRYRHLGQPPRRQLSARCESPNLTFYGSFSGYYSITESVIRADPTAAQRANFFGGERSVLQVAAYIWIADAGVSHNITRVAIGWSSSAGVSWTPLTNDSRPLGETCGNLLPAFQGPQLHFWTGAIGYDPVNQNVDNPICLLASFGGDNQSAGAATLNRVCLMVDDNSVGDSRFVAELFAWYREPS